jgi:(1->4)-alpha-D-glucan 1-alpha-D-glucosylmutase
LNGLSIDDFHAYCANMQATHPETMTTLSTHDTKRSDNVRARLAVLTEIPGPWRGALNRWSRMNATLRTSGFPDPNTEYFLYQTIVGAWPITVERLIPYMEKAAREAKQQTSWTQQNAEFEDAMKSFIQRILDSPQFVADLESFIQKILEPGRINSLAQTLVKFTAPGIPDTYQGSELWDLHLVDPDNRCPVDYDLRRRLLAELEQGLTAEEIMKRVDEGLPKLWVVYKGLQLRRQRPEGFNAAAEYSPLLAAGPKKEHLVAFLRGPSLATLVPRWSLRLGGNWGSTTVDLPAGRWKNILTGDEITGGRQRVQPLLQRFPVALLTKETE